MRYRKFAVEPDPESGGYNVTSYVAGDEEPFWEEHYDVVRVAGMELDTQNHTVFDVGPDVDASESNSYSSIADHATEQRVLTINKSTDPLAER